MKLDSRAIRYLTPDDWRVLTAVEMGSRNHESVPSTLIGQISGLGSSSGVNKAISALAKVGLIGKVKNVNYEGYRLTYGGLDYLALNAHRKGNVLFSVGTRVGVGKESDIYVAASESSGKRILKIHRLGRISFRQVKNTRDYLRGRSAKSWMYMSRLAAVKEHSFMVALRDAGFSVPEPIAQSRHTVVMSLIDGVPLRQISSVPDPGALLQELIEIAVRLARHGLIHGDLNEFNILIEELASEGEGGQPVILLRPVVIDFPQMVSIDHANADAYFDRDIACLKRFFQRRFHYVVDSPGPTLAEATKGLGNPGSPPRLDVEVEASGFSRKMARELENYMREVGADGCEADSGCEESPERDEEDVESDDQVEQDDLVHEDQAGSDGFAGIENIPLVDADIPPPLVPVVLDDIERQPTKPKVSRKKAAGWSI